MSLNNSNNSTGMTGNQPGANNERGNMSTSSSINSIGDRVELGMSAEELEIAKQEWGAELNQVEEEIQTLRHVLNAKLRRSHELKRKLGVTVWSEFTTDMNQGLKNVKESTAYQKTEAGIKGAAEKTTSLLGGIGSAMSQKIGALKNTDSFRSMEERVSGVVTSVKTKMGGSRSGSVQSFDEALREATSNNPDGTPNPNAPNPNGPPTATTPTSEDNNKPQLS